MHRITSINEFIKFLLDLFNDEFAYLFDDMDAINYFACGGCYELAQIIKNYFPKAEFVVNKDFDHCAILYGGIIFDALSVVSLEQVLKMGFSKQFYEKRFDDYDVYQKIEIDNFEIPFRSSKIENHPLVFSLINEIESIDTIKIEK